MSYYAVAKGVKPGIYNSWSTCSKYVIGFKGAIYKKFSSYDEAEKFIKSNSECTSVPSKVVKMEYRMTPISSDNLKPFVGVRNASVLMAELDMKYTSLTTKFKSAATVDPRTTTRVYTDGACRGNGKFRVPLAGFGVFYGMEDERNASVSLASVEDSLQIKPTNQRAELYAIKHALIDIANDLMTKNKQNNFKLDEKYTIYSDSKYSISCINSWCDNWYKNGWKSSNGSPVSNKDIICTMIPILNYINEFYKTYALGSLSFVHVRGHVGEHGNEMADKLANWGADDMYTYFKEL